MSTADRWDSDFVVPKWMNVRELSSAEGYYMSRSTLRRKYEWTSRCTHGDCPGFYIADEEKQHVLLEVENHIRVYHEEYL